MGGISLTPEHAEALRRYEELIELLPKAEEEREQLIGHTLPMLNARYLQLVGTAHLALLQLRLEAFELRRKSEMIRATINRGGEVLIEVIEALLEAEMKEQREKLEQEARRIQSALIVAGIPALSAEDSQALKKLYYQLARMLHPDMHPDQTDAQKDLWLQVSLAYQQGDLERLRVLLILAEDASAGEGLAAPTGLEELLGKIGRLQVVLDRVHEQIATIKSSFPYTHIEKMEDPEWISEQHAYIQTATEAVSQEISMYRTIIDALLNGGAA